MKINIGINGQEANVQHRVGVGQYAFELISHLYFKASEENQFRIYLSSPPLSDLPKENEYWHYEVFGPAKMWTLLALQKKLLIEKISGKSCDVFLTPTHYSPLLMPCPSVVSIMDMSFETLPQFFKKSDLFQLQKWTKASANIAKKVLTISQFSKKEICRIYGFKDEKVVVTPLGFDRERFDAKKISADLISKTLHKFKISGDYILFLGTLQPKKNLARLVEAFSMLSDKKMKLVVVGMINEGRGGWMYQEIFDKIKEKGLEDRVVFTGYVPDELVAPLMKGSKAYVLPSLYEGFGIPAIEAMALGKPVIVSNAGSLPEVCGTGAIYIDNPYDVTSIHHALEEFIKMSNNELDTRIKFGLEWVKMYNWKDVAQKTLDTLYEVVQR